MLRDALLLPALVRVYVRADKTLAFERVMQVVGEVNAAGFKKVALVSEAAGSDERRGK